EPSRPVIAGGPGPGAVVPAAPGTAKESAGDKVAGKAAPPGGDKPPGSLQDEMAKAAGGGTKEDKGSGPVPEPASNGPRNQNIPEQPSQGSVQAAVLAVTGAAKACVAGADEISRAQVTFSSNGTVSGVSVSGWAAAHGKSACVQAAL